MSNGRKGDLKPAELPGLDWSQEKILDSLEKLRGYAEREAENANDWYLTKRVWKRFSGRLLRGLTIVLAAGAGLVPVVSQLWQEAGKPVLEPGWSPLLLGVAALCVLLDRFLGGTSSWQRYMAASQEISDLLRKFRFDWAEEQAALAGKLPDPEQTQAMIERCRALAIGVDEIVRGETNAWAMEFRGVLKQIDEVAGKARKAKASGGIDLEVSNGDQVIGDWRLRIDEGSETAYRGRQASVTGLVSGRHRISVKGEIGGRTQHDEKVVEVPEGGAVTLVMTLH